MNDSIEFSAHWRQTIVDHFDVIKIQTMARAGMMISSLCLSDVLHKFDLGVLEHKDSDPSKLDATAEFKSEMIDGMSYVAHDLASGTIV